MKIIFIRHGDPDYVKDTLTEKGFREANLLADRICRWNVKDFYCSPLGRAQATAQCTLKKLNRKATTFDWLREFYCPITDPVTGRHGVPWDFMPSHWTNEPLFYDKDHWQEAAIFQTNPDIKPAYDEVCAGIDSILSRYGYDRKGNYYRTPAAASTQDRGNAAKLPGTSSLDEGTALLQRPYCDDTIVLFCHLGVTMVMMSHLLGITPSLLWQNFFIAPSSVTILQSEERMPGEAYFRTQVMGDTTHLHDGNEPISQAGYFAEPFQL